MQTYSIHSMHIAHRRSEDSFWESYHVGSEASTQVFISGVAASLTVGPSQQLHPFIFVCMHWLLLYQGPGTLVVVSQARTVQPWGPVSLYNWASCIVIPCQNHLSYPLEEYSQLHFWRKLQFKAHLTEESGLLTSGLCSQGWISGNKIWAEERKHILSKILLQCRDGARKRSPSLSITNRWHSSSEAAFYLGVDALWYLSTEHCTNRLRWL